MNRTFYVQAQAFLALLFFSSVTAEEPGVKKGGGFREKVERLWLFGNAESRKPAVSLAAFGKEGFRVTDAVSISASRVSSGSVEVRLQKGKEKQVSATLPFLAVVTDAGQVIQMIDEETVHCESIYFWRGQFLGSASLGPGIPLWSLHAPFGSDPPPYDEGAKLEFKSKFEAVFEKVAKGQGEGRIELYRTAFNQSVAAWTGNGSAIKGGIQEGQDCLLPALIRIADRSGHAERLFVEFGGACLFGVDYDFDGAKGDGRFLPVGSGDRNPCGVAEYDGLAVARVSLPVVASLGDALIVYDGKTLFLVDERSPFVWTLPVADGGPENSMPGSR